MVARTKMTVAAAAWEKAMAVHVKDTTEALAGIGGGGSFISLSGGQFTFDDAALPSPLPVVIVNSMRENLYYPDAYDPNNIVAPVCFALADLNLPSDDREGRLQPHPTAPQPQSETCAQCPMNKFKSDDRGRGKACKNTIKLAMISAESLDGAGLPEAQPAMLRIPVTSLKNYKSYVDKLANVIGRPTFGVITKIDIVPDQRTQFKLTFTAGELVGPKVGTVILQRLPEINNLLMEPPALLTVDEEPTQKPTAVKAKPKPKPGKTAKPKIKKGKARF